MNDPIQKAIDHLRRIDIGPTSEQSHVLHESALGELRALQKSARRMWQSRDRFHVEDYEATWLLANRERGDRFPVLVLDLPSEEEDGFEEWWARSCVAVGEFVPESIRNDRKGVARAAWKAARGKA